MKYCRSILSVFFALLVLLSSSSFIVGIHLCGGRVQDIALFTHAEDCGMEKQAMPPCHRPGSKPCCENETIAHDGDNFKASVGVVLPIVSLVDLELPHVLLAELIPSLHLSPTEFYNYDSPLRPSDLTVSLHVFRI